MNDPRVLGGAFSAETVLAQVQSISGFGAPYNCIPYSGGSLPRVSIKTKYRKSTPIGGPVTDLKNYYESFMKFCKVFF